MAKKITQSKEKTPRIKGYFTPRTWVQTVRQSAADPVSEAEALRQLDVLVRSGKIAHGPIVGLYPGLQSYYFVE